MSYLVDTNVLLPRLAAAMVVHGLTHLLTFNDRDFKRFTEITVVNPQSIS